MFRDLIEIRENEKKKDEIISTGFLSVFLQVLLFFVLFIMISPFIKNYYKWYLLINVITYIFLSLFQQIARGLGNNKKYSIGSFVTAIFTILFNIILIVFAKWGAYGILLGTIFGQLCGIVYFYMALKLGNYIHIKSFNKNIYKNLIKYSIPLIPNAISWWVFNASDRVIVTSILGVEQNGILAAALKFSAVYITLYNMFNLSWTESITMAINDKDLENYFNKTFNVAMSIFISLALIIISFMPFVYPIIINEKFNAGYVLVPISIIASLFNVFVGLVSVIYVGKKNTKAIANTSIVSAILNIVSHLILIKFIGLYASVISTFLAFFIMSIYRVLDIRKKYFKIKINKRIILIITFLLPLICIFYYINNLYLNIVSAIISVVFTYAVNKESINKIFFSYKKRKRDSMSNYFEKNTKKDCNGCGIWQVPLFSDNGILQSAKGVA